MWHGSATHGGRHINVEELESALETVEPVPVQQTPTPVALNVDSSAGTVWLARGSTGGFLAPPLLRYLGALCERNLSLRRVRYVRSADNVTTDRNLRQVFLQEDWEEWEERLQETASSGDRSQIDAFASPDDARCVRFCSRDGGHGAEFRDFFAASFPARAILCINPGWSVFSSVVADLRTRALSGYLLLPAREDFQLCGGRRVRGTDRGRSTGAIWGLWSSGTLWSEQKYAGITLPGQE